MLFSPHKDLPASLYKYTSANSAVLILRNGTLQWSDPDTLNKTNDGFDVSTELASSCPAAEIAVEVNARILGFLKRTLPAPSKISEHVRLILKLADSVGEAGREKLVAGLEQNIPVLQKPTAGFVTAAEEMDSLWKHTREEMKILCLSKTRKCEQSWVHYCDRSTGAVLEFSTQGVLSIAMPIEYTDIPPLSRPEVWADQLISGTPLDLTRGVFRHAIYCKAECWRSEQEWRVIDFTDGHSGMTYRRFDPTTLKAIYLGRMMTPENEVKLISIRDRRYPHVSVFKAKRGKLELEFDQIK